MPAATNTAGAGSLPTNTCTAAPSANAVSTSNSGKASVADTAECASQADALATSSSTIGPPDAAAAAAAGAPPFPLEHYVLAYTQMQAANYPLPAMSDSGQKILPLGFVASYESGQENGICFGTLHTLCAYHQAGSCKYRRLYNRRTSWVSSHFRATQNSPHCALAALCQLQIKATMLQIQTEA